MNCKDVQTAVDNIDNLEELESFTRTIQNPPPGAVTKKPTEEEWRQIAMKMVELQTRGRK